MAVTTSPGLARLHPIHALLLGFPIALFTTALLADVTYLNSSEMQWSNFAAWAITGALVVGAAVLAWAVLSALLHPRGTAGFSRWGYPLMIALAWVVGLVNAFQHSRDAWASVGAAGLIMSLMSTGFALAAGWLAYSPRRQGAAT